MYSASSWRAAGTYVVLTTVLSWLLWVVGGLFVSDLFVGFVLAGAWMPTVVALALRYRREGWAGVRAALGRLVRWRISLRWYAVAVLGVPAIVGFAVLGHLMLGGTAPSPTLPVPLPAPQVYLLVPVVFLVNVFVGGPIAEELGWRGYLQPLVVGRVGVVPGGFVVGLIWGLWHLPLFFLPGGAVVVGGLSLPWFVAFVATWSVLFAWVVTRTGSLLLAVLLHASINTTIGTLGILGGAPRLRALALLVTVLVVAALAAGVVPTGAAPEPDAA